MGDFLPQLVRDSCTRLYAPKTYEEVAVLLGHDNAVLDVSFTVDNQKAITASADGCVKVWDIGILMEK